MDNLIVQGTIENKIFLIRGKKVMFDHDLAVLYGVANKSLIQAVKRNRERFPEDFMFHLTEAEFKIFMAVVWLVECDMITMSIGQGGLKLTIIHSQQNRLCLRQNRR